ncbi:MAG: cytochrome c maturation protein CcmE [Spirochaetota bacterium]
MKHAVLVIVACFALGGAALYSGRVLSPYVTFAEAAQSSAAVQIIGRPTGGTSFPLDGNGCTVITLADHYDSSRQMNVTYCGVVSENINHAETVAASGTYDSDRRTFMARRLYYKCPSKYRREASPDSDF